MRVVLDTNVILSGLLGGTTRTVLDALFLNRFRLVTSNALLTELTVVLKRPQWRSVLASAACSDFMALVRDDAVVVSPTKSVVLCRDPEDNALLECALAGRVDYLVTGDHDLLTLRSFHSTRILRPAEFLRRLPA